MTDIPARLAALGLSLPTPAAPAANYVPYVLDRGTLYISGQLPIGADGALIRGRLGDDMDVEAGAAAARACALNILAQVGAALGGDWARVARCVRLGGFVACTPDFTKQPLVINGASDLIAAVLGDAGKHARAAVGAPALPLGAAVEVEATFAVRD
jgi:enamine deaminase RidA (YjgF/YER057c/UK114 family)